MAQPPRVLRAVHEPLLPGQAAPRLPDVPLLDHDLLANAPGEPALSHALTTEFPTADSVDAVIAFIRWSGLNILRPSIKELRRRGVRVRLLTTTYTGSTQRAALDWLVEQGVEVRVSYDTRTTRLHAKAWLIHRNTGYSTAYVGSSNLSQSALVDGIEWNVRLAEATAGDVLDKLRATFESLWNDDSFEPYDPARDAERLDDALARTRAGTAVTGVSRASRSVRGTTSERCWSRSWSTANGSDARATSSSPRRAQARLSLPRWTTRRCVAGPGASRCPTTPRSCSWPTGSGSWTSRCRPSAMSWPVADFGEKLVGGHQPREWRHVFASIQSLHAMDLERLDPDRFDVVYVDEFHHAEAPTYRRLLDHLAAEGHRRTDRDARANRRHQRPATCSTGTTRSRCGSGTLSISSCSRRSTTTASPTAPTCRGCSGSAAGTGPGTSKMSTSSTGMTRALPRCWRRCATSSLTRPTCGPSASASRSPTPSTWRASSPRPGIPAVAMSGDTDTRVREQQLRALEDGAINVIFAVDVLTEGVDVPSVDTILLLRPTESATVFLQQLGRGLRLYPDKPVCTVLDFIGQQHRRFRSDLRLRALTGRSRGQLTRDVEAGFPFLPSGCHLRLDRQAEGLILDNLKTVTSTSKDALARELAWLTEQHGPLTLQAFLDLAAIDVEDVYRNASWTELRRRAGANVPTAGPRDDELRKGLARLLEVDDRERLETMRRLGRGEAIADDPRSRQLAAMVAFVLFDDGAAPPSIDGVVNSLAAEPAIRQELIELADVLDAQADHLTRPSALDADVPLHLHGTYRREEVLVALGDRQLGDRTSHREGVKYIRDRNTDVFLVTLEKSERDYSPTTRYRDYAISRELFHWESQSGTSLTSATGKRYLDGSSTVLLFVRQTNKVNGRAPAYVFLGRCELVEHRGEKPIQITWRLEEPMPESWFRVARAVAG